MASSHYLLFELSNSLLQSVQILFQRFVVLSSLKAQNIRQNSRMVEEEEGIKEFLFGARRMRLSVLMKIFP